MFCVPGDKTRPNKVSAPYWDFRTFLGIRKRMEMDCQRTRLARRTHHEEIIKNALKKIKKKCPSFLWPLFALNNNFHLWHYMRSRSADSTLLQRDTSVEQLNVNDSILLYSARQCLFIVLYLLYCD